MTKKEAVFFNMIRGLYLKVQSEANYLMRLGKEIENAGEKMGTDGDCMFQEAQNMFVKKPKRRN